MDLTTQIAQPQNIVKMGASQKLQNSFQTLKILWPVYPNNTNSILGDILKRSIILPFSSSKYFYSCGRLSNLVDLSFE